MCFDSYAWEKLSFTICMGRADGTESISAMEASIPKNVA